jgi:hypothetical protein
MAGQRAFKWLSDEVISTVGGRFTVFHLTAVLAGLGTMLAVNFGWSVPRFGVVWGPLAAVVAGILTYWLTFLIAYALGGCLVGLSLHFRWYCPSEEAQKSPSSRGGTAD